MRYILIIFALLFARPSIGTELTSKSMLVAIAIPAIGGIYAFTLDDMEGMKELTYASLFSAHVTVFLKNTVRRTRPNGDDQYSFPSGHASSSMTGASFLHHRYGLVWGLPMYAIATVICFDRVNTDKHYWTDVIAGAAIGYFSGAFFTAKYPNIWVLPFIEAERGTIGLNFQANFF